MIFVVYDGEQCLIDNNFRGTEVQLSKIIVL